MTDLTIPAVLLPADGHFGSGPSKIRGEQFEALARRAPELLGGSHRQPPVKNLVGSVQDGIAELFSMPEGYQVVLGNGGATAFWDVATFGLVRNRAQHLVLGEFSKKFATETTRAPFLADPEVVEAPAGQGVAPHATEGVDVYAWPQNETSTGAMLPVHRVEGADDDALVVIDGTSAAAGIEVDLTQCDVYYFSPQKGFASEGAKAARDWGFETLGAARIISMIDPANAASMAVAAKVGATRWRDFEHEGVTQTLWSITRDEWEARR